MIPSSTARAALCAVGLAVGLAIALPGALRADAAPDLDALRAAWQHRRAVTVTTSGGSPQGFAALPLPPEVLASGQPEGRDLRLVSPDGAEVPYVIDRRQERRRSERWDGRLTDTRLERRVRSVWTVDLGAPRAFDTLELTVREVDFAKRLTIEASDDGRSWRGLRDDAGIFDQPWRASQGGQPTSVGGGRVHHTLVALPALESARYLRITAQDLRSPPITIAGVAALRERLRPEERWALPAALAPLPGPRDKGVSRYRVEAPPGLPIETLALEAEDGAFARRVRLLEGAAAPGSAPVERGEGTLYRLRLKDAEVDGESLELAVARPGGGALTLEIEDGDSPPLRAPRLTLSGTAARLLFMINSALPAAAAASAEPAPQVLVLYYGNPATRGPSYDLELLRDALSRHGSFAAAAAGPEEKNPRYQPPPPLQVTMSPGALISLERWRYLRTMPPVPREDLYGIELQPADLAALREDLADLRISNGEGRQIPYVLETATPPRLLPMTVQREAPKGRLSRYRLRPEVPAGQAAGALPLLAVELDVAEGVFSRPARLIDGDGDARLDRAEAPRGAEGTEGLLARQVLARAVPEGGSPLRLAVPPGRYRELILEIDDGDNAPLTIRRVFGLGRLPRIAFKLGPAVGLCRIFLGNPEVEAPRYDIEALRQQVLDYSAVPAPVGPLQANLAYRPRAGDFVRSAPPALILWSTLILSVLAMLLLTARLIRKH